MCMLKFKYPLFEVSFGPYISSYETKIQKGNGVGNNERKGSSNSKSTFRSPNNLKLCSLIFHYEISTLIEGSRAGRTITATPKKQEGGEEARIFRGAFSKVEGIGLIGLSSSRGLSHGF